MREPTDEELKDYAKKLPEVYKLLLGAFVTSNWRGSRRAGDSLSFETLDELLNKEYVDYRPGDTDEAVDRLEKQGFLTFEKVPVPYCVPTRVGERLITAITGVAPLPAEIPELPAVTWG